MEIKIKELTVDDCKYLVEWNYNKDENFLFQWAGTQIYLYPLNEEQIRNRLNIENNKIYLIEYNNEPIGSIELSGINKEEHIGRICRFIIKDDMQGKGIGTKALKKLIEMVFEDYGINDLLFNVYVYNISAIRCYEKIGFLVEKYNENKKLNSYTMKINNKNYYKLNKGKE
ncbi:GNAT family N-acetyltransferase [Spirochaetia bacterium]|nr:GNAT family N-acetyltransferase [Spirochaetia bacterium]